MSERATVDRSKAPSPTVSRLRERSRRLEHDARSLATDVEELFSDVDGLVRERLESQPYAMLAIAAGAGFVLGGGLTFRVVSTLTRMGVRSAVGSLFQNAFARAVSRSKSAEAPA